MKSVFLVTLTFLSKYVQGQTCAGYLSCSGTISKSGHLSTAMGVSTAASGKYATAMGTSTKAEGDYSTAMGYQTTASGKYATAMGYGTTASDEASTAMGKFNDDKSGALLIVGNGADSTSRSNAFEVMSNGDANIAGKLKIGDTTIDETTLQQLLALLTPLSDSIADQRECLKLYYKTLGGCSA